jgi:hypothetical protein
MTRYRLSTFFAGACLAVAVKGYAAPAVTPPLCTDNFGFRVQFIPIPPGNLGGYGANPARTGLDERGTPIVYYSKSTLDQTHPVFHRFVLEHECAHHALGHVRGFNRSNTAGRAAMETEADCYAFQKLGYGRREIAIIEQEEEKMLRPLTRPEGSISWSKPSRRSILESCGGGPR